jgi:hypothetical protein
LSLCREAPRSIPTRGLFYCLLLRWWQTLACHYLAPKVLLSAVQATTEQRSWVVPNRQRVGWALGSSLKRDCVSPI